MVGEVSFSCGEQSRDGGLQLVVDPESAHGVMDGRIYHHRGLVWVLVGDLLIHLEEVAVLLLHRVFSEAFDSIGEVEIYRITGANAIAGVAAFLSGS